MSRKHGKVRRQRRRHGLRGNREGKEQAKTETEVLSMAACTGAAAAQGQGPLAPRPLPVLPPLLPHHPPSLFQRLPVAPQHLLDSRIRLCQPLLHLQAAGRQAAWQAG